MKLHPILIVLPIFLGAAATGATAADPIVAATPDSSLARHIDARELRAWREAATPEERAALDFLFTWLPACDLAAWRFPAVVDDIRLALETRRDSPWRDRIPEATFRTWVLPHRVAQEPIQPWRRTLHGLLWPRVRDLSLREAILETNRFCREHVTFAPASPRDQGPLTTMERGLGRCEEESIFFICAARSVGIPARVAWTPWWMAGDGNHAWVEAWDGAGWRFLGACEPAVDLDQAWFREPVRRAGIVLSGAYGEDRVAGERLYSRGQGVSLVNSTAAYGSPGVLRVRWGDRPDALVTASRDTARVHVQIWNYGSLTELAEFAAGDSIVLGPADYFLSCRLDGRTAAAFARVRSSGATVVSLEPRSGDDALRDLLAGPIRLAIPRPETPAAPAPAANAAAVADLPGEASVSGRSTDLERSPAMDAERLRAWEDSIVARRRTAARADSARRVEPRLLLARRETTRARAILETLAQVPAREDLWLRFALSTPAESWPATAEFLLQMDDKDLLEADTASARAWVCECICLRERRSGPDSAMTDSLWSSFVLSPRIDRQPYDPALLQLPVLLDDRGGVLPPRELHARFAAHVRCALPTRLGHVATPSQTWRSGWATPAAARVGLVGLLRRNGVAARVEIGRRWVEVRFNGRWVPCDPLDAGSWDRRAAEVATAYQPPARLRATFLEGDSLFTTAEPGRHFLLARFQNGRFEPDYESDYRVQAGVLSMDVEPGPCWLFAGLRDAETGEPTFVALPWDAVSGEEAELKIDLGPQALAEAREAAARAEAPSAELAPATAGGTENSATRDGPGCAGPSVVWVDAVRHIGERFDRGGKPLLLFVWDEFGEPSARVAGALRTAVVEQRLNLRVASILVAAASDVRGGSASHPLASADLPGCALTRSEIERLFPADPRPDLPYLVLLDGDGEPRLCLSGLRVDAPDAIRRALREIPRSGGGAAR